MTIETLKHSAKKKKMSKGIDISENSLIMENKIKDLSAELRQQRAKNRQLNSELTAFKENAGKNSEDLKSMSDVLSVVNIKIKKGTKKSNHMQSNEGI